MENMEFVANIAAPQPWNEPEQTELSTPALPRQVTQTIIEPTPVQLSTTDPVEQALMAAVKWSWAIVSGCILLIMFELLGLANLIAIVRNMEGLEMPVAVMMVNSLIYLTVCSLLVKHGASFGIQMRQAILQRDNNALALGFYHQSRYFFWVFVQMLLPLVKSFLETFGGVS